MTHAEPASTTDPLAVDRPRVRRDRRWGPERQVVAIAVALAAISVALVFAIPDGEDSVADGGWWAFVFVAATFALFEYTTFHLQFGEEGISFSMSEMPLAFALAFLSPPAALLARLPASVAVLALIRRNSRHKLAFNTGLIAFELIVAILLFRGLVDLWGRSNGVVLVAIPITLVVVAPLTSVLISVAIARFEGDTRERVVSELKATWWMYTVNAVLSTMTVALALVEPALALLAALPAAGIWYVLHSHGELRQELRDLHAVYGFAEQVGGSLDVASIAATAAGDLQTVLRAAGVAVVVFGDDGAPTTSTSGEVAVALPQAPDDPAWARVIGVDGVQILSAARLRQHGVAVDAHVPTVMTTTIREGSRPFAVVVATQREVQIPGFHEGDAARLQNMAHQLAVSLRRGMLHERLEYEARHDALTGLPARTLFERLVTEAMARRADGVWSVMMLDLDRFKEVNDTLGHHVGDALLVEFSRRMAALLGPEDTLARLAGDEFAILCHRDRPDDVLELAQRAVREGGRPVVLDGLEIVVTVSLGVAEITPHDTEAIQPMRRADIAMYNAKWQRTGVEFYRDEIDRRTPARLSMLGDLRTAIETDQLTVVYQPKLDLRSGVVVGLEALVRWDHPARGTVPPSEFVRVAEDTGLIKQLTDLVLASGIEKLAEMRRRGLDIGLAVNLSTHDLFDARLPERVKSYLEDSGVDPSKLTLEITESSLFVDAPRTRATIDGLYAVGLRLAVDDFGTGYSSLSYLRRLPVHELKIDQSFVARMLIDPQDEVIVRSTVDLGHNLGLQVVAEGVEDFAVLDCLRDVGCDIAQGYVISQPVLATDIIDWLERTKGRAWHVIGD